jgi:hypothetical protein
MKKETIEKIDLILEKIDGNDHTNLEIIGLWQTIIFSVAGLISLYISLDHAIKDDSYWWTIFIPMFFFGSDIICAVYMQGYRKRWDIKYSAWIKKHPKPKELTPEERREKTLKENIGKWIILYKAKIVKTIVTRDPVYAFTQDLANVEYVAYYKDNTQEVVTSAETIEGRLMDANLTMVKVDNNWYAFGKEPEKIYEMNIIRNNNITSEISTN